MVESGIRSNERTNHDLEKGPTIVTDPPIRPSYIHIIQGIFYVFFLFYSIFIAVKPAGIIKCVLDNAAD